MQSNLIIEFNVVLRGTQYGRSSECVWLTQHIMALSCHYISRQQNKSGTKIIFFSQRQVVRILRSYLKLSL